jgi:mono/diheme cytochrome c family protein
MCSRFPSAVLASLAVVAAACQQQPPRATPGGNVTEKYQVTERRAGPPPDASPTRAVARSETPDEETLSEGRTLYNQYNCAGCHAAGGGAIGPPLMDDEWIYGDGVENIFYTIVEGRPQGMPAFRGRIPDGQIRTIARFVQSLSAPEVPPSGNPTTTTPANAPAPAANSVERGREVFLQGPCAVCHTIRGTRALATIGPDLTHVASRTRIAGGLLENTRGNLAGWILNPQNLKPGTRMPPTLLEADELHPLLDFLESLK